MALGRKTLQSTRTRLRKVDKVFQYFGYVLLVIYFLYLAVVWSTFRHVVQITSVEVEGTHAVSKEAIAALASESLSNVLLSHIRRDNSFFYPEREMIKRILALSPRIAHVAIDFNRRHVLHVVIIEYTPNFLFCMKSDGGEVDASTTTSINHQPRDCYFADEDGYVYAEAPEYVGYPFVAIIASTSEQAVTHASPIGTHALSEEEYSHIQGFIDDISRAGLVTHSVTLLPDKDVRIEVGMPWSLLWTTTEDPEGSIRNLSIVLTSIAHSNTKVNSIKEIDLRFGNKIFYR